jgi:hypothetical protein
LGLPEKSFFQKISEISSISTASENPGIAGSQDNGPPHSIDLRNCPLISSVNFFECFQSTLSRFPSFATAYSFEDRYSEMCITPTISQNQESTLSLISTPLLTYSSIDRSTAYYSDCE